jgi:hypothetical protein
MDLGRSREAYIINVDEFPPQPLVWLLQRVRRDILPGLCNGIAR